MIRLTLMSTNYGVFLKWKKKNEWCYFRNTELHGTRFWSEVTNTAVWYLHGCISCLTWLVNSVSQRFPPRPASPTASSLQFKKSPRLKGHKQKFMHCATWRTWWQLLPFNCTVRNRTLEMNNWPREQIDLMPLTRNVFTMASGLPLAWTDICGSDMEGFQLAEPSAVANRMVLEDPAFAKILC